MSALPLILLAAWAWMAPAVAERLVGKAGEPGVAASPTPEAARLRELIADDLKAVRRARYALRKAEPDTPAEARARSLWQEARERLRADRIKLRALLKPAALASTPRKRRGRK